MNRSNPKFPDGPNGAPRFDEQQLLRLIDAELSPRARLLTTAMLLFALIVTAVVAALLLTEPALPLRTQLAFGLIVLAGLAWSGHFGRTLLHRRTSYLSHRVASTTLAAGVTAAFVLAAVLLAWLEPTQRSVALTAAAIAAPWLLLAIALRARATRQLRQLRARRDALAGGHS